MKTRQILPQPQRTLLKLPLLMLLALLATFFCAATSVQAVIAQRGTATTGTTSSTSLEIAKPAGVVAGDIMIANISQRTNNAAPSLSGWTLIDGINFGTVASPRYGAVLYRVATGTEGTSFEFELGTGAIRAVGAIVAFSGVDTATPFDVPYGTILGSGSAKTSVAATALTTVTANAAVIMFGMAQSDPIWSGWSTTDPGALTQLYEAHIGTAASVGAAWATKATAGDTGPGAATLSDTFRNGGILVALRPLSSGSTPTTTTVESTTGTPTTYGTPVTFTATVTAGATGTVNFYDGVTLLGPGTLNGSTPNTATYTTTSTQLSAGTHSTITATYLGDSTYLTSTSDPITQTVNKADAVIVVTPYSVTYDGIAHMATVASITGVGGETGATVGTVDVSGTTHTVAGTYSSDSWSFTGTANYNDIGATTITDAIAKANATVLVTPYSVTYDGSAHSATVASITGVNGETGATVGSVTLNTTHTDAGTYGDFWSFTGTANYNNIGATTVTDTIAKANATVVVAPYNVTYDGSAHTASVTSITGVNGETGATVGSVTLNTTHTAAGTYASDSWSFAGTANYNNIGATTITDTIAQLAITGNFTANNKIYDGNNSAAVLTRTLNGVLPADVGNVSLTSGTATFANALAGNGKTVTLAGASLSGSAARNFTANNKIYDGNNSAAVLTRTLTGVLPADVGNVILTGGTATFADALVGNGKTVTLNGASLTGTAAANYSLSSVGTTTANITQAGLTVTGIEALNKVYDGTNTATLIVSNAVLVGVQPGDTVTLNTTNAVGAFADKNIGTGKLVTVSGLALLGADAGKYTLTQPTTNANITAKALTVAGATVTPKVYDGNRNAVITGATLVGVVGTEVVTLTNASTGTFDTSLVGTNKSVATAPMTITGADVGNYTLTQPILTGNITPRPLNIFANNASKTYGQSLTLTGS
ncbi:MAG: YDG domain-containing protein, partial [Verrucomicrobia bacterium]|nr:YDG domain-containing protein [Verrucomicrobiota bacterium]